MKAHVLVAFLGYALWVTLKHLLQRRAAIVPQPFASGRSPISKIPLPGTLHSWNLKLEQALVWATCARSSSRSVGVGESLKPLIALRHNANPRQ